MIESQKFGGVTLKKHIANAITSCRILCSIFLLLYPAFSLPFYILYLLCGLSDMVDGAIARMTNSASEMGAKIDTAADLAFVTASLMKILPAISIPGWLWIWGAIIAVIKISNIIWGYASGKKFIALHTKMNKIAGLLLFLLPLTLSFVDLRYSSIAVCSIATFAAIQEGFYSHLGNE